jgi:hypothetical protein
MYLWLAVDSWVALEDMEAREHHRVPSKEAREHHRVFLEEAWEGWDWVALEEAMEG